MSGNIRGSVCLFASNSLTTLGCWLLDAKSCNLATANDDLKSNTSAKLNFDSAS
jgi:hypothetical protein